MISKDQIIHSSFVRYGALPLGLIALVVVLRIFFFTPFRVMTTAQAPALRLGAWALARHTQSPDRGSLILYHTDRASASTSADKLMVARVVALPGDSLEVRSGQLFVNGVAV
ncbi:MAG: signal peptidase I, partial [Porphyromonadaceae bacterium]|nr:signal peptidase I [Porphyromonadaceae bacterium]